MNPKAILGRQVGSPGMLTGTIIGAGWSHKLNVERMTPTGRKYRTLVPGYIVRWETGRVSKPMPLDRLNPSHLL